MAIQFRIYYIKGLQSKRRMFSKKTDDIFDLTDFKQFEGFRKSPVKKPLFSITRGGGSHHYEKFQDVFFY